MDFLSSSHTRSWSAFASPPWICNTSSNTNRPSQMPSPKSKHTHTWACTANKCDETQIYWHTITRASRHGDLCERVTSKIADSDSFVSFHSDDFQNSNYPPSLLSFNYFASFYCFSFSHISSCFIIFMSLIAIWYIFLQDSFVINENLSSIIYKSRLLWVITPIRIVDKDKNKKLR